MSPCFLAAVKKICRLSLFSFCFFLFYFGLWRCSVNLIKTNPSAWIARLLLRYCNFFPIIFFFTCDAFLGSSCWCFGVAVPTGSCRDLGANFGKPAAENVIIFSSYFEVRCQTSLLKQSGNGKWNVAFVKMPRAVFIRPTTPCKIRGRCFQKRV